MSNKDKLMDNLIKDKDRLDWLEQHSYAFVRDNTTGKGFIRLSDSYIDQPGYHLREAIDGAMAASKGQPK